MKLIFRLALVIGLIVLSSAQAGRTLHVNADTGQDGSDGLTVETAWKTVQKACDSVVPGDTVILHPGVYLEQVRLTRAGTPEAPITFKADAVGRNRVIISMADAAIRRGETRWTLEDPSLHLYSVPFTYIPSRVLYDGVDLLPFPTLEGLKTFMVKEGNPGTRHGFTFDEVSQKLYVRLYQPQNTRIFKPALEFGKPRAEDRDAVGKYGSLDPNEHTMCVAPMRSEGNKGNYMTNAARQECYAWGILTEGPAHVVLDGLTFETPSVAGVYVRGSNVVVRNSWFLGCKAAVAGGPRTDNDTWDASDEVVIEHCDYTQFPAFTDTEEAIQQYADDPRFAKNRFFWWQRKGQNDESNIHPKHDYEVGGIAMEMGRNWIIRNNDVHEVFDGFSAGGKGSDGLRVYNNRFSRVVDNAIQTEDHGSNWRIYNNEFIDNYMAISWQPLAGTPWPGPIYLYRNIIRSSPEHDALWRRAGWPSAWLKAGVRDTNWKWPKHMKDAPKGSAGPPGDGFVVFNNTIVSYDAYFLERVSGQSIRMPGFKFYNNIFVIRPLVEGVSLPPDTAADWEFAGNLSAPTRRLARHSGEVIAGRDGVIVNDPANIKFVDAPGGRFELQAGSPAIGAGKVLPNEADSGVDLGAIPFGQTWKSLVVGPQPHP